MFSLSVGIYTTCHCGFRGVSNLIEYLNNMLNWNLDRIPCANTIENWVKKSGYSIYHEPFFETGQEQEYALIVDESMMLGNEKLLLTLGINAQKSKNSALKRTDVKVLDISVASRWNSEAIKEVLQKTETRIGKPPLYVVSDNDSKLTKAIRERDCIHIRDISHTLALQVEQIYKNEEDFKQYAKALGEVKIREVMRASAYLLPPRQRSVARFMNLSSTLRWSVQIQQAFALLNEEERKTFDFLHPHSELVSELICIFEYVHRVEQLIKSEGLSCKNIDKCLRMLDKMLRNTGNRVKRFKVSVKQYLQDEKNKLRDKQVCWNASSDIIESIFGTYKFKRSSNSLNGITSYVLLLPLLTKTSDKGNGMNVNFKHALESVFMKDLSDWENNNLTENLLVKRQKKLAA